MKLRKSISVTALLLAAAISLAVLAMPDLQPYLLVPLALILSYVGVGASLKLPRRSPGWIFLFPIAAGLALLPFAVVARGFGGVDMLAFLFHTQFPVDGGSIRSLGDEIRVVVVSILLFLVATWFLVAPWRQQQRVALLLVPAAGLVLVSINPVAAHLVRMVTQPAPDLKLETELLVPSLTSRPDPAPDVVYIYLEGLDRRFADQAEFGTAYEPIDVLAQQGLSFTNIGQITGSGWSLAGMVASQCGVPLLPRGLIAKHSLSDVTTDFLSGVTCLTDLLSDKGYSIEYVVGGAEDFGGIETFYRSHAVSEIWGKTRTINMHPADEVVRAALGWVVDDQMVYDTARIRFEALAGGSMPLLMIVETVGPHGSTSSLSRQCTADGVAAFTDDYAASVRCLGDLTASFVSDIRLAHASMQRKNPLRIIITSDHLFHDFPSLEIAPELARNSVILLGGPEVNVINNVPGSMIDLFPTVLDWLGFGVEGANLGRSLLGVGRLPTLVEQHGLERFNAGLSGAAALADRIWSDPS